ncbi:MAG TPA: sulfate adenylyltransferase [Thermoplasmata archaeon]|nr:sulfate adenylyltransferase [Thermoplasmata archaeon]
MIPTPHGGPLVHRLATDTERERRDAELRDLPTVTPFIDQLYDADKIGIGAYSPLDGFQGSETVDAVVAKGRLPNDLPWTIPIFFPAPSGAALARLKGVGPGDEVAILDGRGTAIALLKIEEEFRLDRAAIARGVYGTDDPAHPNVADLLAAGETAWAGPVTLLRRVEITGGRPDPTPAETRAEFARRGWRSVAAYQCRNPPHTAHEYIQRLTLEREDVDALFVHPVVGRLKKGDYRPEVILEAYTALVQHYYPSSRVLVQPLGITMRYGGPKAALFLAIVRKNFGCGVYIVGRDQAGVGKYYDPYACHRIFDAYDIGIVPLRYEESFFCRRCGWMASEKVCPHDPSNRVQTSQTRIRESLANGSELPVEILRPEVAAVLRQPNIILTE